MPGVLPELLLNEPPAPPSLHIADVAPPQNMPPRLAVLPPRHMGSGELVPVDTNGLAFTVSNLLADVTPHAPPAVVSVKVTVDIAADEAV